MMVNVVIICISDNFRRGSRCCDCFCYLHVNFRHFQLWWHCMVRSKLGFDWFSHWNGLWTCQLNCCETFIYYRDRVMRLLVHLMTGQMAENNNWSIIHEQYQKNTIYQKLHRKQQYKNNKNYSQNNTKCSTSKNVFSSLSSYMASLNALLNLARSYSNRRNLVLIPSRIFICSLLSFSSL